MAVQGFKSGILKSRRFRKSVLFLLKVICVMFVVFAFCEYLIYYAVIAQCSWPVVKRVGQGDGKESTSVLKAMFLSDTHLLGKITGHWFDKLRREWQMEQSFQSALWLLQPDVVFILGDVFDEGKWNSPEAWEDDVTRFQKMFRHPPHTELVVLVGNHDIGFHYETNLYKLHRFEKVFNFSSANIISRKGVNFVLVNSIALEGDGCVICKAAEEMLIHLSHTLNCSRKSDQTYLSKECSNVEQIPASAPILLQHFPLYRTSDFECTGEDSATLEEKAVLFKEKYDVLSQEASQKLLWWLHPRLILSGHTHSACKVLHDGMVLEISVPSFSWRNRNNPSFIMASFTATDFSLSKCFLPVEDTVIYTYIITGTLIVVLTVASCLTSVFPFAQHIDKHKQV